MEEIRIRGTDCKVADEYDAMFSKHKPDGDDPHKKSIREKALEIALDTRKFEIGLYWERAKYFWTLLGITFGGYIGNFLVLANKDALIKLDEQQQLFASAFIPLIISVLGVLLSWAWYCVNKGSKYWQENWENHVALLEDDYIGPLFKTLTEKQTSNKITDPVRYSVSKINILVSLFVFNIWIILGLYAFFQGLLAICTFLSNNYSPATSGFCQALCLLIPYAAICLLLVVYVFKIAATKK